MNATALPASFFDGETSRPAAVELVFERGGFLRVMSAGENGTGVLFNLSRREVSVDSRLGGATRFIRFANGTCCEVAGEHNDRLDAALAAWDGTGAVSRKKSPLLHRLESSWRLTLTGSVLLLAFTAALLHFGTPWLARVIAFSLPDSAMLLMGKHTLEVLDEIAFEPSETAPERQRAIREVFAAFLEKTGDPHPRDIAFRSAPDIGANAFALPSGIIVLTDDLVLLAEHEEELLAVLAHECGHVDERHAVRSVVQTSLLTLLLSFSVGDVSAATTIGGALPSFLLQNHFSREFEREADAAAVRSLQAAGITPDRLADILERLDAAAGNSTDAGWDSYLSTHPGTAERRRSISESAGAGE